MKYKGEINTFVVLRENQDLRNLELSEGEWSSIKLISGWLEKFRDTTTQMSTTHQPVTVDESICEEDGSDDEEKDEDKEDYICQLLNQRTASQRRDKSCAPSH